MEIPSRPKSTANNTVGFCLLPSELIQDILLYLALPEIVNLKLVNKFLGSVTADQDFVRECNSRSKSASWLFVYKKRWRHHATLHGFTDRSDRWFKIPINDVLEPFVFPSEDLYFLTASGNVFLFASNTRKEVISVNLARKTVKKIPPSPLGPRGTSSWRRSGMKLLAGSPGSDNFRFVFAEMVNDRPVLLEYTSETDTWTSTEAEESGYNKLTRGAQGEGDSDCMFLNAKNGPSESMVIAVGSDRWDAPVVLRPRFRGEGNRERRMAVGFSCGDVIDRLHVYGDGYLMIIRSDGVGGPEDRVRVLKGVETWGLSSKSDGRYWEFVSKVPSGLMEQIKKPYGVMMGCLEARNGKIRAVLMSNYEGSWDMTWLSYDVKTQDWDWVPLPDCKMKGLNMAGISFSSGLTMS